MAGLIKPAVDAISNRSKVLAAVEEKADPTPVKAPAAPEPKYEKPITAAEAEANQARRKAAEAAEEKARGMPKPGLLERAKKFVTGG
jgi:hypothetical protein